VLFTTNNLFDYLPASQLKKTLEKFSASGTAQHIHHTIGNIPLASSLAAIIIKPHSENQPIFEETIDHKPRLSQNSMDSFISREKATDQWLNSAWRYALNQLLLRLKDIIKDMASIVSHWIVFQTKKLYNKTKEKIDAEIEERKKIKEEKQSTAIVDNTNTEEYIEAVIPEKEKEIETPGQDATNTNKPIVHPVNINEQPTTKIEEIIQDELPEPIDGEVEINVVVEDWFNKKIDKLITIWSNLTKKSKIAFVLLVLLLVIFANGISYQWQHQVAKEEADKITDAKTQIEDLFNQGTAASIYQEDDKARALFQSALKLYDQIPESAQHLNGLDNIKDQIQKEMQRLRKVVEVNPEKMASLNYSADAPADFIGLVCITGQCFSLDKAHNNLTSFDLKNKKYSVTKLPDNFGNPTNILPIDGNNILVLTQPKKIWKLTFPDKFTEISVDWASDNQSPIALGLYNQYLYIADGQSKQIIRYTLSADKISGSKDWFKQIPTSTTTALSIDSDVYLVNQNAELKKYTKGDLKDFIYSVEPNLSKVDSIYTAQNISNIYLTESYNSRIVMINKKGSLINQYTSPVMADNQGTVVEEKNKKIYFVTPEGLYQIKL